MTSVCPTIDRAARTPIGRPHPRRRPLLHNVMVLMSNDLIGELTTQIYDDMGMRATDATVLVAALYEFLI